MFSLMPSNRPSSLNVCDANCGPLSDIALSGKPKRLYNELRRMVPVCSAVIVLLHDSKITPFVDPWSTTTMIESKPSDVGRSVMKSIVIRENGRGFTEVIGCRGGCVGCRFILCCWQKAHPLT